MKKKLKHFFFGFIISVWVSSLFHNGIWLIAGAFVEDTPWLSILMFVLGVGSMALFVAEAIAIGKNNEQSELYKKEKEQKNEKDSHII